MTLTNAEETETQTNAADGQAMRFSSSLMAFVANNGGQVGFHLSDWIQSLEGAKKLIWFENSSHFPFYEERDKFIIELVAIKNEIERLAKRSCEDGDHSA